jgi:methionyl-tRNA formyltransferase
MARLVFMGTPAFARWVLEVLWETSARGWDVVGVLTRPDKPVGRGQQLGMSPVKEFAAQHAIPVQQPPTLRQPAPLADLAALQPDAIVVAAYGLILPQAVLDLPPYGCLNVHASLLPRHRGASPVTGALLAGDNVTGSTIMLMDAGMDTGPILTQASLAIEPGETAGSLTTRLAEHGARLLVDTLPRWLTGQLTPRPQDHDQATYTRLVRKEDGQIDWRLPAAQVAWQVQAYEPWPGAYTSWQGRLLKIRLASPAPFDPGVPGTVLVTDCEVSVVCGAGRLVLSEVQLEGKRVTDALAFARGQRDFAGSVLGS